MQKPTESGNRRAREMRIRRALARQTATEARGLALLGLLAILMGAITGALCAGFRWALQYADSLRILVTDHVGNALLGPLLMAGGVGAAAALAAGMVRRFAPDASGSGIPHVDAVLDGELPPSRARLIPIKFAGGVLAIGGGLALGREGPSVQMGAACGTLIGRLFGREWEDRRALIAGGAGAGLATAFNAPVAGALLVLEELVGRFEQRIAVVAIGASGGAIIVSRGLFGDGTDFAVEHLSAGSFGTQPLFLLLGLFAGLLAVLYNRSLLQTLNLTESLPLPVEVRAGVIGAAVGLLGWYAPGLVGGGDQITQRVLNGEMVLAALPALFLLRLVLGAVSYAAATPGGLFAPMLVLGAVAGLGFGQAANWLLPGFGVQPEAFAVVGMAALFAGAVRSPLTGIILVTEMIDDATLLLPLLTGCFGAMLVAEALRAQPIYTALRHRAARSER